MCLMIWPMAQAAPHAQEFGDFHKTKLSPESQARIIHLLYVDELSVSIVAERMGVNRSTIRRIQIAHSLKTDARKVLNGNGR